MNGNLALEHCIEATEHEVVEQRALLRDSVGVEGPGHGRISETERTLGDVFVARNVNVERLRAVHLNHTLHDRLIDPYCRVVDALV